MRCKAKIREKAQHTRMYVSISSEFLTQQRAFSVSPKCKGISLIEMLLGLAVVTLLLFLSIRQYSQYKWSKDVTQIQESVTKLLQATNVYYYSVCGNQTVFKPPMQISLIMLQQQGGLRNINSIVNPWGEPYKVWIVSANTQAPDMGPPYVIQVQAQLDSRHIQIIDQIVNLLGAEKYNSNTLSWTRLPTQSISQANFGIISSGGWVPPNVANQVGGTSATTQSTWLLRGDLEFFRSKENQENINKNITSQSCPN